MAGLMSVEDISIHSLRMEGDALNFGLGCDVIDISIHSLRMEGDCNIKQSSSQAWLFQSTPSAWRETALLCTVYSWTVFQSTPSAWRETLCPCAAIVAVLDISIHSLRMEGDSSQNNRSPCRRISIHSLRMEGDIITS